MSSTKSGGSKDQRSVEPHAPTVEEWWKALEKHPLPDIDRDGYTRQELEHLLGLSRGGVQQRVARGVRSGVLELGGYVMCPRVDGRLCSCPWYRLRKDREKKSNG